MSSKGAGFEGVQTSRLLKRFLLRSTHCGASVDMQLRMASSHFRKHWSEVSRAESKRGGNAQAAAKVAGRCNRFFCHVDLGADPGGKSRHVVPASVSAAPRVVRDSSWTPMPASSRASRRLTIDLATPSRSAAAETPPASATATNVHNSSMSNIMLPYSRDNFGIGGQPRTRSLACAWPIEVVPDTRDDDRTLANRRGNALGGTCAHVADGKHAMA